ncbi:MAG TPA: type II toxin-antitoxin system VapC family toxin [Chloroflexota bacterium]|nr:type II toxin-antitoxin system VapC family toxin [Chloroflexota bacterium]
MIYLDTSYLVRLYFADPGVELVRQLAASDHVACALHGQAETIAAFHRKFRERAISLKSYRALLEQFATDNEAGAFRWLPSGPDVMQRLREVYAGLPATTPLRAADAIHLATAAVHGHRTVYSNDAHLLNAAGCFGLKGQNIIGQL